MQSVKNWLINWPNAIRDEEAAYLEHPDDLVYISQQSGSYLNPSFKNRVKKALNVFRRLPKDDMPFAMDQVYVYDDELAEKVFTWLAMVFGFAMTIVPLWILLFVTRATYRLAIMTGFVFLFLTFIAVVTTARPFESLAAAAAYVSASAQLHQRAAIIDLSMQVYSRSSGFSTN